MTQVPDRGTQDDATPAARSSSGRVLQAVVAAVVFPYVLVAAALIAGIQRGGTDPLFSVAKAYAAFTIWLPLWCLTLAALSFSLFHRSGDRAALKAAVAALTVAGISFTARVYATHIEPNLLFVRHVVIRTPKVDRALRILHVTDIQTDRVRTRDRRAFRRMRELNPDLIIHTGDLLHPVAPATYESELPRMAELWASLDPPLGKFNVIGDTDWPIARPLLSGGAAVGGLRTLNGEDEVLTAGRTRLRLLGLSVAQSRGAQGMRARVARWLAEGQGENDLNLLFGHAPDYVLCLDGMPRVDLCLAGHTHGGQIRIPFFGPPITFSSVPREWARGYHETPGFRLNVSAGIGAEHYAGMPSIRVNCPPEMTLIELLPE